METNYSEYGDDTSATCHGGRNGVCRRPVRYVVDYGGGIGACRAHLGTVTAWAIARRSRSAYTASDPSVTARPA